jgi:NPCBM/NEW2 domain-containing protein
MLRGIRRSREGNFGQISRCILGALALALLSAAFGFMAGCKSEKGAPEASHTSGPVQPAPQLQAGKTRLGDILVTKFTQAYATPRLGASVEENPLSIGAQKYQTGFGTHAISRIEVSFPARFKTFTGACGVDDEAQNRGTVVFKILNGEKILFESPLMKGGMKAAEFSVPVDGLSGLALIVEDGGDDDHFDHADWVNLNLK